MVEVVLAVMVVDGDGSAVDQWWIWWMCRVAIVGGVHGGRRLDRINETFHEQTDEELTKKELKQELHSLPEEIYVDVDSCETAQEIWLCVQQMMKGYEIGIQEKKAKLFNEWERFTSTDGESTESYYHPFSKLMNDFKRNKHFPKKIASNLKWCAGRGDVVDGGCGGGRSVPERLQMRERGDEDEDEA
ncbi:hypothetical protein Tco_1166240, partial [Tanacetum coccineum]